MQNNPNESLFDPTKMSSSNAPYPQQQYPNVPQPVFNMEPPPPYSMQQPLVQPNAHSSAPPAHFIHISQPGGPHVITVQPIAIGLSPNPVQITCPKCHATTLTETRTVPGLLTYLMSGALFLCGCWFGCCLVPCCLPDFLDIEHRCSNCKINIGTYRRL